MKLFAAAALALAVSTPALATPGFTVTFEKAWDFGNGAVDGYYNGGTAADGTTGPNLGVGFVGISGFTNDALGPYYANAPSPLGTAYAFDTAYINIASGVNNALRFFYSSPVAVTGALRAYSGLNGGGTLLASFTWRRTTSRRSTTHGRSRPSRSAAPRARSTCRIRPVRCCSTTSAPSPSPARWRCCSPAAPSL